MNLPARRRAASRPRVCVHALSSPCHILLHPMFTQLTPLPPLRLLSQASASPGSCVSSGPSATRPATSPGVSTASPWDHLLRHAHHTCLSVFLVFIPLATQQNRDPWSKGESLTAKTLSACLGPMLRGSSTSDSVALS